MHFLTKITVRVLLNGLFFLFLFVGTVTFGQSDSLTLETTSRSAIPEATVDNFEQVSEYAYHAECSLTTSNSSKKWCTEVTLERIILQNYTWPVISDSSTFENREYYTVKLMINAQGKITSIEVSGGTNMKINDGIKAAIKKAAMTFVPAKDNSGSPAAFVYEFRIRAFAFKSKNLGPSELQMPLDLPEEEQEKINQDKNLTQYRMN